MFSDLIINYIVPLTAFLTISFGISILLGFSVPTPWGDALAVLLVGLGSISFQAYLIPLSVTPANWILYSTIGTTVGVAISFGLIEVLIKFKLADLDNSHVITFPFTLLGLVLSQYILIRNVVGDQLASSWLIFSITGWTIALFILMIVSRIIDFEIQILENREQKYSAVPKWGLAGLILGLCYTVATAVVIA